VPSDPPPKMTSITTGTEHTITPTRPQAYNTRTNIRTLRHLGFQWHLDGDVISVTEACALVLPPQPDGQTAEHILRLTVTDSCGARIERTWRVLHADP